ncbi:unnamed protein product [Alopecurus aequalis]
MAEGSEEKNVGGEENPGPFPPGFRFIPTDEEMIEYYLLPRLQGRPHVPNDAIIDDYVYSCHPDDLLLNGKYKDKGQDDAWYFLSSRARKYVNGDRPSRSTDDGRGRWKASTGSTTEVTPRGNVQYCHRVLNYFDGPSYKDEDKGKWLMKELTVPQYENKLDDHGDMSEKRKTLDKFAMCKIYLTTREKKKRKKKDDDEAGPSCGKGEETCPPASQPGPAVETGKEKAKPKISKRRKGKRHVDAETPKQEAPAAPPPPDRCLGPQAGPSQTESLHGGGMQGLHGGDMQARFGTTTVPHHYGGTGPPMAYNSHTSKPPRPPMAYNSHTSKPPRPPMAYNPHTSKPPRPPMAYNPHTSKPPRPPMAFNNGQMPACRPTPVAPPAYFDQPMMMPHLGPPAGQALIPPRPMAVRSYPETQRQPETEEMRERRVYEQHIHELTMRAMMQHQQSANAAYAAQRPPPPPPTYFGDGFYRQHARPMSPWCNYQQPVEAGQQVQRSYAATTTLAEADAAGSIGAKNEGTDIRGDCNNDEEKVVGVGSDGRAAPADGNDTQT